MQRGTHDTPCHHRRGRNEGHLLSATGLGMAGACVDTLYGRAKRAVISRTLIGTTLPEYSIEVEKYPLRLFASAIGEFDPIHHDEDAAAAAGYRSLVAPPTYVVCLNVMANPDPNALFKRLGVDPARILHGEQQLSFHSPICAGDRVFFNSRIHDIYDKRQGTLEFVVLETLVSDQHRNRMADTRAVIVVRGAT